MNPTLSWPDAVSAALTRYADFDGRARRSEYWGYSAFLVVVVMPAWAVAWSLLLAAVAVGSPALGVAAAWWAVVASTANLALVVPSYAVAARRLHDTDRSAVWLALVAVPYGGVFLYYLWALDSQPGANPHGPNPKGVHGWWRP